MNRRAFTLIELLVAMGIIVLLSAIAGLNPQCPKWTSISGGVNAVTATLELGRSLAIQNGEPVLVAFRPRVRTPDNSVPSSANWPPPQSVSFVEITLMKWSGDTVRFRTSNNTGGWSGIFSRPVDSIPRSQDLPLPDGICVASPRFFRFNDSGDDDYVVTGDFVAFGNPIPQNAGGSNGFPFEVPAILFDRTGAVAVNNPDSSAQGRGWTGTAILSMLPKLLWGTADIFKRQHKFDFQCPAYHWWHVRNLDVRDEPFAGVSPFVTIYDQKKALIPFLRSLGGVRQWRSTSETFWLLTRQHYLRIA